MTTKTQKRALTNRQRLFTKEYLIDLNATQAAIRAGYSEKTAYSIGEENLRKPEIQKAIQALMDDRNKRLEINADWVLRGLVSLYERCVQAKPVMKFDHEVKEMVEIGEYSFNAATAARCLELIGRHAKVNCFPSKVVVGGEPDKPLHHSHGHTFGGWDKLKERMDKVVKA